MQFYRSILSQAWEIVKKNKRLWWFGLFAALLVGNGGEVDIYFKNLQSLTDNTSWYSPTFWLDNPWAKILERINDLGLTGAWSNWLIFVLGALACCLIIWFIITSQIVLINQAAKDSRQTVLSFFEHIKAGQKHWWQVFCVNILNKLIVYVALLVLAMPWLAAYLKTGWQAYENLYLITGFIILVPLAIIISFLVKYSINYILIEKLHIIPALEKAGLLFIKNWLISLEMAVLMFLINTAVSFIIFVCVAIFSSPFLIISAVSTQLSTSYYPQFLFLAVLAFVVLLLAIIIFGAMFSAFQWIAWTLFFKELTTGKAQPKLVRWFKK